MATCATTRPGKPAAAMAAISSLPGAGNAAYPGRSRCQQGEHAAVAAGPAAATVARMQLAV